MATDKERVTKRLKKAFRTVFLPRRLREVKCSDCGRPYMEFAERDPEFRFTDGNVEAFVYLDKTAQGEFYRLRVGAWRYRPDGYFFGQLFERGDFISLFRVVNSAVGFIHGRKVVIEEENVEEMSLQRFVANQ
jgi:hypothetical protein